MLGEDGVSARRLGEKYEFRPQQLEMAAGVERAFSEGHHLLVEAGTGDLCAGTSGWRRRYASSPGVASVG